MSPFFHAMWVVARRDFVALVATPTFLLFLLAPLFMFALAGLGGVGAAQIATSSAGEGRMVALLSAQDAAGVRAADVRLRPLMTGSGPVELVVETVASPPSVAEAEAVFRRSGEDIFAVMTGPLAAPRIIERNAGGNSGRYLVLLANEAQRDANLARVPAPAVPSFAVLTRQPPTAAARQSLGYGAVFVLFLLTLLLAGQSVSMLAEEKGNKVVEILAAAIPLEAVFMGKLLGLLAVSFLFIAFWAALVVAGGTIFALTSGAAAEAAAAGATDISGIVAAPATGWGFFLGMGLVYFVMAFLLLGAIFLGVGAQAASVREIQMLSLPITIFQVAMFGLSSAAANQPGSGIARFAEIFPFSSPFAMAARAATSPDIAPHLIGAAWQALCVAVVIAVTARLFRAGVLSGNGWQFWRRRRRG